MYTRIAEEVSKTLKKKPFYPLADLVYEVLLDDVVHARILPGVKINESKLADSLNFSRTPITIAIQRLIEEDYLTKKKSSQAIVKERQVSYYENLISTRKSLEMTGVSEAAKRISKEDINKLTEINELYGRLSDNLELYGDSQSHAQYDHAFHKLIMEASKNKFLIDCYKTIEIPLVNYRYLLCHRLPENDLKEIIKIVYKDHVAIINALSLNLSSVAATEISNDIDGMQTAFNRSTYLF